MFLSDINIVLGKAGTGITIFTVELLKILKNEINIVFDCDGSFIQYMRRNVDDTKKLENTRVIQTSSIFDIQNKIKMFVDSGIKCNVFIDSTQCIPGQIVDKQYNNFISSLPFGPRYIITKYVSLKSDDLPYNYSINVCIPHTKFITTRENDTLFVSVNNYKVPIKDFATQYMRNKNLNILLNEK